MIHSPIIYYQTTEGMLSSPLVLALTGLGRVCCEPAAPQAATHISALPLELLQHIFRHAVAHLLVCCCLSIADFQ